MRTMKIFGSMVVIAGLLAGCKATVETEVSVSELLSGPSKQLPGTILVEVPACSSHEDSRQPSSTVLQVQKAVPGIFSDATYQECYRQGFNSYARFAVPIALDKDQDGKLASDAHVNLISNERGLLSVSVPDQVKAKIAAAQKKSPVGTLDLKFSIKVKNDTDKDLNFSALAAFVDQTPHVISKLTAKKGASFVVTLSDVSARSAVQKGDAPVLLH